MTDATLRPGVDATRRPRMKGRRLPRLLLTALSFLAGAALIPHRLCRIGASDWFEGDLTTQSRLAEGMGHWVDRELTTGNYNTGSSLFDGEWLFGTYQMAVLGYVQTGLQHPQRFERDRERVRRAVDHLLSERVRDFDTYMWSEDPLESLDGPNHHVAYRGYLDFALSMLRLLDPEGPHAEINDRITAALIRHFETSPTLLLETYPSEVYPVDNASAIGAIAMHARATGSSRPAVVDRWLERFEQRLVEEGTGLLHQSTNVRDGSPSQVGRGSGTTLAAYFLAPASPRVSRKLMDAVSEHLFETVLGFGAVREYPHGVEGHGDIDSGPLIFGYSVSATGFGLGAYRVHQDAERFEALYGTYRLFGIPHETQGTLRHLSGGPIGDAIMFAMLTALPASRWEDRP